MASIGLSLAHDPLAKFRVRHPTPDSIGACAFYQKEPEGLAHRLWFDSRFGERVELFKRDEHGRFWIPRGLYVGPRQGVTDDCSDGLAVSLKSLVEPRDKEQERLIQELLVMLSTEKSGILQAPTGTGKTVLACHAIAAVGRTTMVVVPKDDLVQQWRAELSRFLGLPSKKIGHVQQNRFVVRGCPVVVGSLSSLSIPGRYPSYLRDAFGFLVLDECHRLAAPQFSIVAGMFSARYRLGLSATPRRADGKEILFQAHIGLVRVVGKTMPMIPRVLRYRTTWRCPVKKVWDERSGMQVLRKIPHAAGKVGHILKSLARHAERNKLLSELIRLGYERGRKQVVFTDLLGAHAEVLLSLVVSAGVPSQAVGLYAGAMKKAELERVSKLPVLIATYGKMGLGTNIPDLDMAIFATPRSDVTQAAGRVLRQHPGKKQPVLVDLVDEDSWVFTGYAESRLRWYQRIGAEVKELS